MIGCLTLLCTLNIHVEYFKGVFPRFTECRTYMYHTLIYLLPECTMFSCLHSLFLRVASAGLAACCRVAISRSSHCVLIFRQRCGRSSHIVSTSEGVPRSDVDRRLLRRSSLDFPGVGISAASHVEVHQWNFRLMMIILDLTIDPNQSADQSTADQ